MTRLATSHLVKQTLKSIAQAHVQLIVLRDDDLHFLLKIAQVCQLRQSNTPRSAMTPRDEFKPRGLPASRSSPAAR